MSPVRESFRDLLEKLSDLPTLPNVVTQITALMQNPRTSASEIGLAITNDPSMASKTLKLVNSAFYGFPGRIKTITHAIVILGFTTVKNLVLTTSIFDLMGKDSRPGKFNLEAFWFHSISTGVVAKVLAGFLNFKYTEEVFIGGILHDIGKIVLHTYANSEYQTVLEYREHCDCLLIEAEKEVIGVTHFEMGGWVAEKWNLPKDLAAMIQYHHNPQLAGAYQTMAGIIHLSDIIARGLGTGSGGDNKIPVVNSDIWDRFKLDRFSWTGFFQKTDAEIDKAKVFLQLVEGETAEGEN